eukprot:Platyproteum_vivax@DN5668_c0_g1_i1.p1
MLNASIRLKAKHLIPYSFNCLNVKRSVVLRNPIAVGTMAHELISSKMKDKHGRQHTYLRISLTDQCNLRCGYCMPETRLAPSPPSHYLTCDEILRVAKLLVQAGVSKIRVTGGEPTVRKDFANIIEKLAQLEVTLGVTTNGLLLHRYWDTLQQANVHLNISLDTLQRGKYQVLTRSDGLPRVLKNLATSLQLLEH